MTFNAIVAPDLQRSRWPSAKLWALDTKIDSREAHLDSSLTQHMICDTPLLPGLIGDRLMNESGPFPILPVVLPVVASNVIVPVRLSQRSGCGPGRFGFISPRGPSDPRHSVTEVTSTASVPAGTVGLCSASVQLSEWDRTPLWRAAHPPGDGFPVEQKDRFRIELDWSNDRVRYQQMTVRVQPAAVGCPGSVLS